MTLNLTYVTFGNPCLTHINLLFFFNDTATTEIYTLSLHDALPISARVHRATGRTDHPAEQGSGIRSEEHTSELQSRENLVCRLLLEKKKMRCKAMKLRNINPKPMSNTNESATS